MVASVCNVCDTAHDDARIRGRKERGAADAVGVARGRAASVAAGEQRDVADAAREKVVVVGAKAQHNLAERVGGVGKDEHVVAGEKDATRRADEHVERGAGQRRAAARQRRRKARGHGHGAQPVA
jgi:hypothetical protein